MRTAIIGTGAAESDAITDMREVMNIRQASQYLGVSPDTLYKYLSRGNMPAFKLGNRWRFKKTMLDRWMEHQSSDASLSSNDVGGHRRGSSA
jgi:excisionase family DNA binding protein